MKSVGITLPDGSQRRYDAGVTPQMVAHDIGKKLEDAAVAAKINGKIADLGTKISTDSTVSIVTKDSKEGLEVLRHSTAHLLAQAVKELYPETLVTIGPVTEEGFYYDFDRATQFVPDDLPKIEKKMEEIAARKLEVFRQELSKEEAVKTFQKLGEKYKVEIISGIAENEAVSAYTQGDFIDLCRGPHVPNTAKLGKFKLLTIAGAYWRGDEKNKMLQRVYGTAFATQKELDEYLARVEEAKKRDHRKLGPELGLFAFLPEAPAMPFYLPKGTILHNILIDYMRQEMRVAGYQEVICPQLMNIDLWKTSGHLDHYRQNMFFVNESETNPMSLKPMNCPGHILIYASSRRSYRELPIRYAEFTKVHRNERAGVTHGILRVRNFSIDDGHVFCTEEQIEAEALALIRQTYEIYRVFGFSDVEVKLATRPQNFIGSVENWDKATQALESSLKSANRPFSIEAGEGAFYGPKIEFHIRDSLGRFWQCGTIQLDFSLPERFRLEYVDKDGSMKRPVMIHRAILGSLERFFGILIEHHAGHLPFWLSPTQVLIFNVTDDQEDYVRLVGRTLESWGIRVELDLRNEKLGYKIREGQLRRIPIMVVVGKKEVENRVLSIRKSSGEMLNDVNLEQFRTFLESQLKSGGISH